MQAEPIPQQVEQKIELVESADLVVGVLAEFDQDSLATLCEALRALSGAPRIAVLRDDHAVDPALDPAQANSQAYEECGSTFLVPWPLLRPETPDTPMLSMSAAYQSVFAASEKLGARACCVIASRLETQAPDWVRQLAQPLLEDDIDLVVPRYARHKFEG
ncbi:MAG: hypothetical protein WA734_08260, partial [Candidatus Acidiferrales bacterium]